MKKVWIIARREVESYFSSLAAYVLLVLFLGFTGFFTWLRGNGDIFFRKQADLEVFFAIAMWTLFFFIPAVTMRMLAEERRSGTIEMLLTKKVQTWQLVLGKFLATMIIVAAALVLTLIYYFSVSRLGNIDHGATISGYIGLLLLSAAYAGIGIFASSISKNQIVAFLIAISIGILFQFIAGILASDATGAVGELLAYLDINHHYQNIQRGVLDTRDVLYFLSVAAMGLLWADYFIERKK